MSVKAEEILQHMLDGTKYEDDNLSIADGTLYWHNVPVIVLHRDKVEFCSSSFVNENDTFTVLIIQRAVFNLMQQRGMIDQKELFPAFRISFFDGYSSSILRHEPDDTRGLL